ncbi:MULTISPECIES: hypothetical protein [Nocardia]|uniref:Uncharacterized protein n=1 Tax=Nocardia implantans TaxID=3108168 RepID=A0ABU6ARM0_9NOCA|nr:MULTISPECIES: hypothetical protein [unclassified Nocardia]MBF6191562.1 hypothetical protein [Nocardia beijingensis]MEA3528131.1 hypothetical protein [Nocardia sp. CDC192]MEB3510117.1 hypothetical protein [Nocardia sp. CDC186]
MRYRLAVVAATAVDVVRHAGGWLCDRTMAGWEVTVLLADCSGARSLQILGATVLDLERSLATPVHDTWPHAVAVAQELFAADARVRQGVLDCLDHGLIEVALWGEELPEELDRRLDPVHHRLSVAARAFKGCALTAAGAPASNVGAAETFRSGELLLTGLWGGTDLVAVG